MAETTIVGDVSCTSKFGNVGEPSCGIKIDHLVGFILTYGNFEIPNASLTDFDTTLAYLQASTLANGNGRTFYIPKIFGNEDSTPAADIKKSGYGFNIKQDEKSHEFTIEFENKGIKFHKNLRKFRERKDMRVLWIDTQFIGGLRTSTGLRGFECTFMANQVKVGVLGGDPTKYTGNLQLEDPSALEDKLSTILFPEDFDLSEEMGGILDVELFGTGGAGTATIGARTEISRTDLYADYSTLLADTDAWKAIVKSTGATATITTVTKDDANKKWILGLAAGTYLISMASPAELAALTIGSLTAGGFESETIEVVVTVAP